MTDLRDLLRFTDEQKQELRRRMMTDTLHDRIAAAITGIRIQRDGDSYRMADAVIDAIQAAADAAEREP